MSHLNHLGNQYSYNQGYADAREQAAQRLHDEIDALRHSVECHSLSPALHAMVNKVLRGAFQPGGIIHRELKDDKK